MKRMSLVSMTLFFLILVVFAGPISAQTTIYKRMGVIPPRPQDPEGYGNLIAGDVTGSGTPQIYAVSGELHYGGIIPRIYEFTYDGTKWDSVWASVPDIPGQNTWCPLTIADLDGDGRMEVVWGPINDLSSTSTNPIRLLDYEAQGNSSNNLGLDDGNGGFKANATWTMTDSVSYNTRPFRWVAADVNNDGRQELIFTTRAGGYHFGVVSVDDIPDYGTSGSATWKMDTSGIAGGTEFGSYPDVAVIDSTIYIIDLSGNMQPIYYANGKYTFGKLYTDVVPGGTWKSAQVVDLNNDGKKEILIGAWSGSQVYLLQPDGDSLKTTEVADFADLGCNRLNGSTLGDFNGDGHMDIAFGSRSGYADPDGSIYVMYYNGGDITSMSSYSTALVDSSANGAASVQWDMLSSANFDPSSKTDEIVYSGIDRGYVPAPIVVLSSMDVSNVSPISDVTLDANNDYVPDNLGATKTVIGVVNGVNMQGTARFSYTIQDGSAGCTIFNNNVQGPVLKYGDRVMVTGKVAQYKGSEELDVADPSTDVAVIDSMRYLSPMKMTLEDYLANPESVEGMLVEFDGVALTSGSSAWPSPGSSSNMEIWDGYKSLTMRIDSDTELPDSADPTTKPFNVTGVATQYTSSTPPNDGYQIIPSFYNQFTQDVAVPPSPYFFFDPMLKADAQKGPLSIKDSTEVDTIRWTPSIDLNGDAVLYQVLVYEDTVSDPIMTLVAENGAQDTLALVNAKDVLAKMAGRDTISVHMVVLATTQGLTTPVSSVDTLYAKISNDIVTGISDVSVPHRFFVDQNYPNPFNPTTTIRFGLHQNNKVDLRVYDILGQQVAVLINNQVMNPGQHEVHFNASKLASGTYIYRLQAGQNVVTKKMILLK